METQYAKIFRENIENLGGKVIGVYKNNSIGVPCICKAGHSCCPKPGKIQQGRGMCKICASRDSRTTEENFYKNIESLGGKVIGTYVGCDKGIKCICKNGHICHPNPSNIKKGRGMCKICAGQDCKTAEENFYKNIENLGGKILGKYVNNHTPVKCVCKNGHFCTPSPGNLQQGNGICKICAGNDCKIAENNFYKNIENLGGNVIGKYVNAGSAVLCMCKNGHSCRVLPNNIQQGGGLCSICSGYHSETTKENFYKNIENLGGKVIGKYVNARTPILCTCKNGHECSPWPTSIQQNNGMCKTCNESKLERFFSQACKTLNISYTPQYKNKDTKNSIILPYDFHFTYNSQEIRVELQGHQHFFASSHYHEKNAKKKQCTVLQSFIDRLTTDNKKSFNTLQANHNFLSISDLATNPDEILAILQDFLSILSQGNTPLARYYITKDIYTQYKNNKIFSPITFADLQSDEILQRFQIYFIQAYSLLKNKLKKFKLYPCTFCGEYYSKLFLPLHYHTKEHEELLKESLENGTELVGINLDGNAIVFP